MDSQNNSFSQSPASIDPEETRRRFLESMGIGIPSSGEASESSEIAENEEVVLSSQPEDLELPGVNTQAPSREQFASFEIERNEKESSVSEPGELDREVEEIDSERDLLSNVEAVSEDVEDWREVNAENRDEEGEEEPMAEPVDATEGTNEEPLLLSCPKCHGELVLMPQHIGVEGACVWCEMKIVAAKSGTDGEVRVFPLFQPDSDKSAAPEATAETSAGEKWDMISRAKMDPAPLSPDFDEEASDSDPENDSAFEPEEEETPESVEEDWAAGFDSPTTSEVEEELSAPTGFSEEMPSGFDEAPVEEKESEVSAISEGFEAFSAANDERPSAPEENSTPEEAIPDGFGSGFDLPKENSVSEFSDEAPKELKEPSEEIPSGFSGDPFAESMGIADQPEPSDEEAPATSPEFSDSWGSESPSETPDGFSASPFEEEEMNPSPESGSEVTNDEEPFDDAPSGFSEPMPWGAPDPAAKEETSESADFPSSPVEDPSDKPAAGFSEPTPWGPPSKVEPENSVKEEEEASEKVAENEGFGAGFDAAPPETKSASVDEAPKEWGAEPVATFELDEEPSAEAAGFEMESGFGSGFEIPASDAASFPEAEGKPISKPHAEEGSIFSPDEERDSSPEEVSPAVAEESKSAAAPEPKIAEQALAPEQQLFTGKSADDTGGSLFGAPAEPGSKPTPPPLQESPAVAAQPVVENTEKPASHDSSPGPLGAAPNVTSKPLKIKPAKQKGRGLTVFLVVILGLVCGAALASFVLPVDDYVTKARIFMEQKLNMEPGVDPATFLSEMVMPGGAAAPAAMPSPSTPAASAPKSISAVEEQPPALEEAISAVPEGSPVPTEKSAPAGNPTPAAP